MRFFKAYAHQKIFFKLLVSFLLIGILPLFLSGFAYYAVSQKILVDDTGKRTYESIGFVSSLLDGMINENSSIITNIESNIIFKKVFNLSEKETLKSSDTALVYNSIYQLLDDKAPKVGIYVMNTLGTVILSNKQIPEEYDPVKYKNWGVFRKANTAKNEIVIYPYRMYEKDRRERVLSLSKAVFSGNNIVGYIIVDLYQEHFTELLTSINNPERFRIIGRNLLPLFSLTSLIQEDLVNTLIKKTAIGINPYSIFENSKQHFLFSAYQSGETGLQIAGIQPLNQLINVSKLFILPFFILAAVTSIFSFFMAFLIARNFSQPLYEVISCVEQVEKGDFTARTNINRKDEFAILGKSVNAMILKIRELINNIKQKERSLRVAEMEALQAQIHPHLIFNTLEMIKWNIRLNNPDEASHIVMQLAKLLRQGIDNKDEMVTVIEEIKIVEIYLDIQKRRFEDKLKVEINVDSEIAEARIPKYIIQPIVENSIIHGIRDKIDNAIIIIKGYGVGSDLFFEISDNGKGIKEKIVQNLFGDNDDRNDKSNSIGMQNVMKRIKLYYGNEYGLYIESTPNLGTKVVLKMRNDVII